VPPETAQSPYGPVTTPPPQAPAPQATQPQPEAAVENFQLSAQAARLIPAISPQAGKTYKFQVGSYKVARNAVDTYVKLREAGLTPDYERNGEFFRVVLYGVQWNEVQATAEKLGETGFKEALIREE
ncbi:MAG: SPOR domain-containing protein, partial [Treponema sp.]|nr:SPOR domain-containing protein [Treponema sp.]